MSSEYKIIGALLVVACLFQPFFLDEIQSILIFYKLIGVSILAVVIAVKKIEFTRKLLIILLYFTMHILYSIFFSDTEAIYRVFLVLSSIILPFTVTQNSTLQVNKFANAVITTTIIYNCLSLFLFVCILYNVLTVDYVYELVGRKDDLLFRYCLGNPIEIPLVTTAVMMLVFTKRDYPGRLFWILLNLILVVISQSRILVLINILMFISLFVRNYGLIRFGVVIVICYPFLQENELLNSVFERFNGNDYGSGDDRLVIYKVFYDRFSQIGLGHIWGYGALSSIYIHPEFSVKSLESTALEYLYEFGFIGLLVASIGVGAKSFLIRYGDFVILMLLLLQVFFFINFYSSIPLVFVSIFLSLHKKWLLS